MSFIKKVLGARGGSKRGVSKRAPVGAMLPAGRGKLPSLQVPMAGLTRTAHAARPLGMPRLPRRRPVRRKLMAK
jgi:hypothetical protein